ncbi:DNA replication/repair protein RecF [Colwellia sp. 20A7]|uniref:DNA replication/repair protein RecF n=1 Tax=Colwellia sp. 20A7 TaxID=2689569 RepID=UPI00135874B1|nr:DNA replication/repair protein RecF [Colwellia sp. 20A7]
MSVVKLVTNNFRNLNDATIDFHSQLNFFVGDNGSGKSSLLEALFFLGHGKSFRTSKLDALACHEKTNFVVSVRDGNNRQLGLSRDITSGLTTIKIDGEFQNRLSVLAKNIAIQIVTPESFKLFFGGPRERRRFVDLGMFHVKHSFAQQWKNFNRVLKQRNACIRLNNNSSESNAMLAYWTDQFCQLSVEVASVREEYSLTLIDELDGWLTILLPNLKSRVTVQYLRGWPQKRELAEVLFTNQEREAKYGYSLYGAHKFDVKFLLDKQPLETQLSRGQQKLFLLALTFTQAKLIARVERVKPILLIDDIGAELDINSRKALSEALEILDCQVVITAISNDVLTPFFDRFNESNKSDIDYSENERTITKIEDYKVFHVKHGEISAMSPNDSDLKTETAIE